MKRIALLAAAAPLVLLGGCATKGDIETLRQEIAGVRAIAQSAEQKAAAAEANSRQAAADAQRAAQDAQIAGEKADRIFRAGLRK
ncbi:MAG: Lpp/OprI family alanine-zipper lipoprotein [Geminicoccaceae bacterium]|nr:Lpp/OprI family alanine-zipper lipoprotein [Geminicoccaceae bacterium]MCX8099870.1 Lpp/OprI family alanine-zipper lipoprotein [Geminicoccaceae bacterium]MDW8371534.1 Lpp/OprI family alanine-zipper lipoprotein [Geminicoccaceae bacterium]